LEGLAEAGGICISGTAFDQAKNKLPVGYQYMGKQEVKNIPEFCDKVKHASLVT
jgi:adenylate cyclase